MKRIETTTSARVILSLVALLVATPASALTMVSYDGSGSPTGDGFIITGNAGIFTLGAISVRHRLRGHFLGVFGIFSISPQIVGVGIFQSGVVS